MSFIPHSSSEIQVMLDELGLSTPTDLFKHIPNELYLDEDINIFDIIFIKFFNGRVYHMFNKHKNSNDKYFKKNIKK